MEEKQELRPCPFCGCEVHFDSNRDWHRVEGNHLPDCVFSDCDDPVIMVPATEDGKAWVTGAWNRRTPSPQPVGAVVADGLAERAAQVFCGWRLPQDFSPDFGISFKPLDNTGVAWPTGTNLFSHQQAKAMFAHCLRATLTPQPAKPAEIPPEILNRTEEIRQAMANPVALKRTQLIDFVEFLLGHIAFTKAPAKPAEVGGVVTDEVLAEAIQRGYSHNDGIRMDHFDLQHVVREVRAALAAQTTVPYQSFVAETPEQVMEILDRIVAAPQAVDGAQGDPLAVLTLGGIDGDEFDAWDLEVFSGKTIDKLQKKLVRTSEPVILNLYAAELAAHYPAPEAAQAVDLDSLRCYQFNGMPREYLAKADVRALLAAGGK